MLAGGLGVGAGVPPRAELVQGDRDLPGVRHDEIVLVGVGSGQLAVTVHVDDEIERRSPILR